MVLTFTFEQQLALNAIGPAIAVVFGSIFAAGLIAWLTRRAQDRREERALRDRLINEVTEKASALHFEIQRFYRARTAPRHDDLKVRRQDLDATYAESRLAGVVLENRLLAYFADDEPRRLCHQLWDRLAVRYYFQVGRLT